MQRSSAAILLLGLDLLASPRLAPIPASASDQGKITIAQWRVRSECAREAIRKFPDYTPASIAQRNAYRRRCLREHNLSVEDAPVAR
ncbi:MAG TPA: hypothetical protein VKT70_09545 [Stellaceae bacterium]|nr:hypothetical protein [Stellaceae bacterium]